MKILAIFMALLLGATISALAQSSQSRIVDLSGNGVAGVVVECKVSCQQTAGPPATATTSTETDEDGKFNWPVPGPPGLGSGCALTTRYVYTLKKSGYIFTRATFFYLPRAVPGYKDGLEYCPVEYIGKQPTIEGLDQLNVRLPRSLIGKGDVKLSLTIKDIPANEVHLRFK